MQRLTDHRTIRALCEKHGFSLSKGFGQHFLVNPGICPKLCDAAGVAENSRVLEVGPGFGTLTAELASRAAKVVAVELDTRLLPVLEETLAGHGNVQVVQGDAMKLDLAALIESALGGRAILCANLPYNITSPLLMRLLEERLPLDSLTVMVQKEAADRITAAPGSRAAGAISYAVHYYAEARQHFTVSPGSFYPPPRVNSAVITLVPRPSPALAAQPVREKRLFSLIRAGFAQRRKTLANSLSSGLGVEKAHTAAALEKLGLAPLSRPEQLTLGHYIALEAALWPGED